MNEERSDAKRSRVSRRALTASALALALLAVVVAAGCQMSRAFSPGTLEVRVVDAQGNAPMEGATVDVRGKYAIIGETYPVRGVRPDGSTDARGVLAFERVGAGEYDVAVGYDGYLSHRELVDVSGGETTVHVVALRHGARIRGRLLDHEGTPLPGVAVHVLAADAQPQGEHSYDHSRGFAKSGPDGVFLTGALEPGSSPVLRLHVFRDGEVFVAEERVHDLLIGVNEAGDLRVRDTVTDVRLAGELPRDALRMQGAVVTTGSDGASRSLGFHNAYFSKDGVVRVRGLPAGRFEWRLVETRLGPVRKTRTGPALNETLIGSGRIELSGPRREIAVARTPAAE